MSLLGVEVFAIDTGATSPVPDSDGDVTTYPVGFTARMERPHESETPDRDW